MEKIGEYISPIIKYLENLQWSGLSRVILNIGGIILLIISFMNEIWEKIITTPGLRILVFIVGIVALIDSIIIIDEIISLVSGRYERKKGEGFLDGEIQESGRVYLKPRIPMISGSGLTRVEIRGNPGEKVIYWPSGGEGLGGTNDIGGMSEIINMGELREKAMGCGVVVLDEDGRGMGVAEKGCEKVLYREVYSDGKGGVIKSIRIR